MGNDYTWWREALNGSNPTLEVDAIHAGFWRMRNGKDGPFVPVAIWCDQETGDWICLKNGAAANPDDLFNYCCKHPITKEDYDHYIKHQEWRDAAPGIGHNAPPEGLDALTQSIEEAADEALKWLEGREIKTKTDADRAGNLRASLQKLYKRADDERKEKKRPHLDANKAIEAEYKPLLERAKDAGTALKSALTVYLRMEEEKERKRIAEIERKQREKEMAERKRIADEAAKAALENREPEPIPEPDPKPEPIEQKKVSAGGATGNRVTLRTYKIAEITDLDKAFEHWKDNPRVRAAIEVEIQKLANATIKTGEVVEGVEIKEERRAA